MSQGVYDMEPTGSEAKKLFEASPRQTSGNWSRSAWEASVLRSSQGQHRGIRVPSFHNSSQCAASPEITDLAFTQTQPAMVEDETLSSPPRGHISQPELWGTLTPIEDFARTGEGSQVCYLQGPSIFRIGRATGSQLHIVNMTVSSRHCSIIRDESNGNACIIDHGSSNGTYVNHVKLEPEKKYYLSHGDCVSLVAPGKAFAPPPAQENNQANGEKRLKMVVRPMGFAMMYHVVPNPVKFAYDAAAKVPKEFLAKYAIREQLGQGNFATVYSGVSRETGENVAIKVIERSRYLNMSTSRFAQQAREAEVLRKLQHPGIVGFRDLIHTPDAMYVVTELLEGGELFDRLVKHGAYSEAKARILTHRVVDAVAYLHDRGVVHRDLKPENIVLKKSGDDLDVKLVDFGVATELQKGGRGKTFCGSMTYVAPEVLQRRKSLYKKGSYREAVDMWSVGVIVYVMLTLRPPFDEDDEDNMHETLQEVLKFKGKEWDGISPVAKSFIASCFELDEEKRITAKQALTHEWLRI